MRYSGIQTALISAAIVCIAAACSNTTGNENAATAVSSENFVAEKINGKYTVDRATSEELKVMENTVVNFTVMIKRQPENMAAYNEYGNLLQNHIERINKYCGLDANTKTELCNNLNLISEKVPALQQNDVAAAAQATGEINTLFAKIDSSFAFRN
ncbi:MAG: hypothetical protein AB7G44_10180 [Bacteroidia bacterium]